MSIYDNFGRYTKAQQIAFVLGARLEASYEGEWLPYYRIIAGPKTEFRVHPDDAHLEEAADKFLKGLEL